MFGNRRVLIVEDDGTVRRGLARMLRVAGLLPMEAASVAEAIGRLNDQAVAVLDMILPDGDGAELLKHIRTNYPRMRVAFFSASHDSGRFETLARMRPDAIFEKHGDLNRLIAWVTEQCQ